ncbi:MAG: NADPH-dependent glutamate synthase [Eggerthellaceae bacterium]|nr:NADPH-dependent glutamate synthase [Eggerthellaceae bacterium]MCH4221444.1 NADPH-dependent glutamate synthase [Eggerthellaceae bacterium]
MSMHTSDQSQHTVAQGNAASAQAVAQTSKGTPRTGKRVINRQKEKTPMAEQNPATRTGNFREVGLGYTLEQARHEASRCLQCKNAPCIGGCPVGVNIPRFLKLLAEGSPIDAYLSVKETNALPAICGRVCPQETQCEGVCRRGRAGEPVAIGRLERFVADWGAAHRAQVVARRKELAQSDTRADEVADSICEGNTDTLHSRNACRDLSSCRVALVGSGPASLTCAGELARAGVQATVFEALHTAGGVLSYGIPEFRLPKDLVAREISYIKDQGVTFEFNAVVGKLYDVDELLGSMGFDAIFIGTGAGVPRYLGIPGEGLNGVSVANELLERVNLMKAYRFPDYATPVYAGSHCVVVGGGNVAMDAARTARRLGSDVTVVYRRGREEMPARDEEIRHAEQEGITFDLLNNPTRAIDDGNGWISELECIRMELGEPDASGRRRPQPIAGSEHRMPCDMLISAIGSRINPLVPQTVAGLEVTDRGAIVADEQTGATSVPGVYAGGDDVSGAATVILAMGAGKRSAHAIIDYLSRG